MATGKQYMGLGDFHLRASQRKSMTVVFFGGSLTWGANASDPNRTSYRALIGEKLRKKYPHTPWRFIDAAIGGSGSQLGLYRVHRDVVLQRPHLVFLDFTLNDDMMTETPDTLSSYESIIRTIISLNKCPVIPVFLASKAFATMDDLKKLLRRTNHLKLADYYHLAVGDAVKGMNNLYKKGRLDPDEIWPPELFDECHPHDKGYELYAHFVWQGFLKGIRENKTPILPTAFMNDSSHKNHIRFDLEDWNGITKYGWHLRYPEVRAGTFDFLCSRWMEKVAIAGNCKRISYDQFKMVRSKPKDLTFTFRGSNVLLFGESTVFSGKIQVDIDGKTVQIIDAAAFATHFAPSAYLSVPIATGLDPSQVHSLTIHPLLSAKEPQEIHLSSICISGPKKIWFRYPN